MRNATLDDYGALLFPWLGQAESEVYDLPGTGLCCFGPGESGHWSLQTNGTAFTAFAIGAKLAEKLENIPAGIRADKLRDRALGMLRFAIKTHKSGTETCTDGERWGHFWISVLCLERMLAGIEALDEYLTDEDREDLRRVFMSESDWLLDEYTLVAGPVDNNKPESNLWNGVMLMRTAMLYPDAPRAEEYRTRGRAFLLNSISLPADRDSQEIFGGKPLSEWHVGNNFFETLSLNHHGYLNVGYMVITLSNLAMFHFTCRLRGMEAPEELYLHAEELWDLVKLCTFPDGRMMRIGGDTRARYCYCQDYSLPVWFLAHDRFNDAGALGFEAPWLEQVKTDQDAGGDGTFLGARCAGMRKNSPNYFLRLEGDKAATLAMAAWWRMSGFADGDEAA
ncbi:MAG: hypothetical protein JXR97_07025, partial [Planctomycetes bacterium]|nr:hypothetical protein [Planctomycetota bacterium]